MNTPQNRIRPDSKKTLAGTVTVVITVGVVVAAVIFGKSDLAENITDVKQTQSEEPEQCVQRMLESAQRGDIESYFACFADDLQDALKQQSATKSTEQFASELRKREADLKNFVTKDLEFPTQTEASLELERTYHPTGVSSSDHNTRYRVRLKRIDDKWNIVELVPLEQYAPKIPFGTPVVPGLDGRPNSKTSNP